MKNTYVVGQEACGSCFIRIYDCCYAIGTSLTLEEAQDAKERVKNSKIYKLVEVEK